MFLKSLQWRLVSIFILITISLMTFVGVFLNKQVETSYYHSFSKDINEGFNYWNIGKTPTKEEILASLKDGKDSILFNIIGQNKSYTIIDRNKSKVEYSSAPKYYEDPKEFEKEIFASENLMLALSGGIGDKRKLTYYGDSVFFDYAKSIGDDNVVYFRYDSGGWKEVIDNFNKIILSSALIAIIASLIIGYILSKTITVPIVKIMHRAKKIADGDFDQVLEVRSGDEIGKLTTTFNYMAKELKSTLIEISSEKNKIETILNYMTDGVIAFNIKGEVIHANPASKRMLGLDEIIENFNDFSKKYKLELMLEDILYLKSAGSKEKSIKVNDTFVSLYFAVFTDEENKAEGIIAVLHDITEQQKLESMRKEFVANVSHELRTPLTSIKSYTETILDGVLEDRETTERFLNVINSEADRMTRLVKDLLQLSRLDNQQMQWNIHALQFTGLVKGSVEKLQMEAKNKDQIIESFVIGEVPDIKADRDRVEQVILNILSNAIKYTPRGGKITVYIGKLYRDVYVKVIDTGLGIPHEDLPRVFERFYRVDKARSREMGGTGLGLSIAREIIEAHGGSISVNSEIGKGTEVTVKLPICN